MTLTSVPASMTSQPTVSIIVANYNGAAYLADALKTACRQTLHNIEIIVSDDASTDDSIEVVKQMMVDDSRIRLITSRSNRGPAAARNEAIKMASGEWIAVMDSDDLMHPNRLETLVESAREDGADIVADDLLIFDSDHIERPRTLLTGKWSKAPCWVKLVDYVRLNHFYGRGPILGYLKPLIRSSALAAHSGPYDETLKVSEDYNLIVRLLYSNAKFRVYPNLNYFYRKHARSVSHRLSEDVIVAVQAADLKFMRGVRNNNRAVIRALEARLNSVTAAFAFERLLGALRTHAYLNALTTMFLNPRALTLMRFPIGARAYRIATFFKKVSTPVKTNRAQVCVISNQRIIGRTNGSSAYLLDLVAAIVAHNMDVHLVAPSSATLGRWPYLILSEEFVKRFKTVRIHGTLRIGNCFISKDPRRVIRGALALLERVLLNRGLLSKALLERAPYSVAVPLTRKDQLFVARHAPIRGDYLIADYCFLTASFPYALRPDAHSAVVMHDLFSSRPQQFATLGTADSVVVMTEDEESKKLAEADCIVAVQRDEAAIVRRLLPTHCVIVTPFAANPLHGPQPGKSHLVLFVGSNTAPNVDGLRWFLQSCWSQICESCPDVQLLVAGTVSQQFGRPPQGVKFLGLVEDLAPLYLQAGLVISPLRVGSGLKIKLIEALEYGKAVVASPITMQGVADLLSEAVRVADSPAEFTAAVVSLLKDENLRIDLATKGREALSQHFSPEICYGPLIEKIASSLT